MTFQLVRESGAQWFDLRAGGSVILGRALTSDLPVVDPTISRRHAELGADDDGIAVRDLDSSNGTFINGERVRQGRARAGDTLTFGKVSFLVHERRPTPADLRAVDAETGPGARVPGSPTIRQERRIPAVGAPLAGTVHGRADCDGAHDGAGGPGGARDRRTLELLLEVSKGLSRTRDADTLLHEIGDMVFELLETDRVSLLLLDDAGNLVPRVARDARGTRYEGGVPQSIVRRAVDEKVAILADNAPEDARFGGASIIAQGVRSALCAPLVDGEGGALGVLYVDNATLSHSYTDEDLGVLIAFAGIAGVAIENSRFAERLRQQALIRSNFERYFAPAQAERIANTPGAARLGGERRSVAVLFSDIRGFTPLSEGMRPDEVASLLSEYFSHMVECVFRHGGTLDKFIGDALMAQWGAPLAVDADADRALGAALDMMTELTALNRGWRKDGRPELGIGIGLTYGDVFAGNIGSERRLEYTIIGDTVNVAARLCDEAAAGEILLTESLRAQLREPRALAECEPMTLRGKRQAVRVYRVAS